ncbi:hypothetical protein HNY73_012332 [Argiope bruennichi]|uniref:Uncharacterized protein n=1 Tax=Argiope bruennichi TaxID=94029 RepID=A0A8T0EUK0_ARGBR|nr:hypothetical protein HNY73_012332 [Argiope bruennichi]
MIEAREKMLDQEEEPLLGLQEGLGQDVKAFFKISPEPDSSSWSEINPQVCEIFISTEGSHRSIANKQGGFGVKDDLLVLAISLPRYCGRLLNGDVEARGMKGRKDLVGDVVKFSNGISHKNKVICIGDMVYLSSVQHISFIIRNGSKNLLRMENQKEKKWGQRVTLADSSGGLDRIRRNLALKAEESPGVRINKF